MLTSESYARRINIFCVIGAHYCTESAGSFRQSPEIGEDYFGGLGPDERWWMAGLFNPISFEASVSPRMM